MLELVVVQDLDMKLGAAVLLVGAPIIGAVGLSLGTLIYALPPLTLK